MQTTPSFLRPSMPSSSSQLRLTLLLLALALLFSPSQPAACTSQHFSNNKTYTFCADLPALNAFLHWTYDSARPTLSIAFVAPPAQPDGWVAWAINPTASGMKGSQALVAFKDANGVMAVRTYNVSSYGPLTAASEVTWFEVQESAAEFSDGVVRIFATLVLPEKGMTVVNHVWQVGSAVNVSVPEKHGFQPDNMNSKGSLDLLKGNSDGGGGDSRTKNRNIHGLLNVMSWGIMLPIGVLVSRYIRAFPSANPAWFYLHISCQFSGYAVGVAGWATGLKLGSESKGITHSYHRNIGITLFALATLQILVSFLRPKKDHKYRLYWNIYHHGAGYAIIALSIINVFKGFEILKPQQKWRTAYIVVIAVLGGIAVLLEAITWIMFGWRKKFTKP